MHHFNLCNSSGLLSVAVFLRRSSGLAAYANSVSVLSLWWGGDMGRAWKAVMITFRGILEEYSLLEEGLPDQPVTRGSC